MKGLEEGGKGGVKGLEEGVFRAVGVYNMAAGQAGWIGREA